MQKEVSSVIYRKNIQNAIDKKLQKTKRELEKLEYEIEVVKKIINTIQKSTKHI